MLSYGCSNQLALHIRLPFRCVPVNEHTHTPTAHTLPTYLPAVYYSNYAPRRSLFSGRCLSAEYPVKRAELNNSFNTLESLLDVKVQLEPRREQSFFSLKRNSARFIGP